MPSAKAQQPFLVAPETRERILQTASRLFSENGYDQTSLSQVAREAGVSKALVLWHFDTKDGLFRTAIGRTIEPFFIDAVDLEGLAEPQQIQLLIDQFYEFVRENVYSVRFLLSLIVREEKQPNDVINRVRELYGVFRGLLTGVIERGRLAGTLRTDVKPDLDAALILATLDGVLVEHFMAEKSARHTTELVDHLKQTTISRLIA